MIDFSTGPCERCGHLHLTKVGGNACTGHISKGDRKGQACKNPPRKGQLVCKFHGGNSPQALAAAEQRQVEDKAAHLMRRFGGPIDTTPTEALLDTVKWTAGYVAWLREKVADIRTDSQLVWGMTRAKLGGEDHGTTYSSGPNVWLTLLADWSDRLVKVCSEAIKAGIEERKVRLAESQGQLIADVIKAILRDLQLTPEQQANVSTVVPHHLRLLTGGAA